MPAISIAVDNEMMVNRALLPVTNRRDYADALTLAGMFARGARGRIHAIYVIEIGLQYPIDAEIDEEVQKGEDALTYIESLARKEKLSIEAEILQARHAGPAIVQEALNIPAGVVVMNADYDALPGGYRLNPTTEFVLKNASCPVALWRQPAPEFGGAEIGS